MASIEEHLARIKEEERIAVEQHVLLREQKETEYPLVARNINARLAVLRQFGVVSIIEEFTHKSLDPLYIEEDVKETIIESGLPPIPKRWPTTDEFRQSFARVHAEEQERIKLWHAGVLRPLLKDDLSWDTNLNIELFKQSDYHPHVVDRRIDIVFYDGNILEIKGGKGQIFSQYMFAISSENLVLPERMLFTVTEAIAKAVNDPVYLASRSRLRHNDFVIGFTD